MKQRVTEAIKNEFKPEFLNRLDDIIIFRHITKQDQRNIVDLQVLQLQNRLAERKIEIIVSEKAKDYLAEIGYDTTYGARPLKRLIQQQILDPLAMKMLETDEDDSNKVAVNLKGRQLEIQLK